MIINDYHYHYQNDFRVLADCSNPSYRAEPDHVWSHHSLPVTDLYVGAGGNRARVVSSSLDQTCKVCCYVDYKVTRIHMYKCIYCVPHVMYIIMF